MDLRDLVRALLRYDALGAREWMLAAERAGFAWSEVAAPRGLDEKGHALAAGLVELMAERTEQPPPAWVANAPTLREPLFLVRAAEKLPRLRDECMNEGPAALRRRGFLAPAEFLKAA